MPWISESTFSIVVVGFFLSMLVMFAAGALYYYLPKIRDNVPERDKLDYDIMINRDKALVVTFKDKHSTDEFKAVIYCNPVPGVEDRMHITSLSDKRTYSFYMSPHPELGLQFSQFHSLLITTQMRDSYSYLKGDRDDDINIMMDFFLANELNQSGNAIYYTKDFNQLLVNSYFELKSLLEKRNEKVTNPSLAVC